jgi:hypothetical protein
MTEPVKPGDAPATPPTPDKNPPADPAAGDKTPPATPEPAPADYSTVKAPDGSKLDPARVAALTSWAKDKKLPPEVAQDVLNREHEALASYEASQVAALEKQKETWLADLKNDKEIGGEKLNASVEPARRLIDKFGSPEFKKALDDTGLGNHPELVRFVARIAKAVGEDNLVLPSGAGGGAKDPRELFYGAKP